jgi:hypothetical protein
MFNGGKVEFGDFWAWHAGWQEQLAKVDAE